MSLRAFESLEYRQLLASTALIEGSVFDDANANLKRNVGEAGIPGVTVYLDKNNNKKLDADEKSISTRVPSEW